MGWLVWNTYIKPIDKTITLFLNCEKGKEETCKEFLDVKNKLVNITIADEIEKAGIYHAKEFFLSKQVMQLHIQIWIICWIS